MVVDDDEVQPDRLSRVERLVCGGPAIDTNDEPGALCLKPEKRWSVGTVTLAHPVGDIKAARGADRREEAQQQGRGGRSIDVIVTKHDDFLATADRLDQSFDRAVHIL